MIHLFLFVQQRQHVLHVNKCTLNQPAETHDAQLVLLDAVIVAATVATEEEAVVLASVAEVVEEVVLGAVELADFSSLF